MLSDEEKEKLEQEFQYALDNLVSKIKGETATAIVVSEQSMILLFERLMFKIEKQSKEIEELKEDLKKKPMFLIKDIYSPKLKEINLQDIEGLIEQGREEVKDKIKAKIEEYEKEIQIRKNVINNDVLDKQTIEKARIEWACMEDFIYEMQSLLEKE